jgi:hypothetical protein
MAVASLSVEAWAVIGLIAGLNVIACLAALARAHRDLMGIRRLAEEVRTLRRVYDAAFSDVDYVHEVPAREDARREAA